MFCRNWLEMKKFSNGFGYCGIFNIINTIRVKKIGFTFLAHLYINIYRVYFV